MRGQDFPNAEKGCEWQCVIPRARNSVPSTEELLQTQVLTLILKKNFLHTVTPLNHEQDGPKFFFSHLPLSTKPTCRCLSLRNGAGKIKEKELKKN